MVNAYLLPLSALLLLGGALGDHFGRRRLLIVGTFIFGAASLVCALAPNLALLLAARAAQGIGAALLFPNSLALLNAAYSGEKRGRAVRIWAAAGATAAAIAPLIGGWLVDAVGWPAIFYINLPLALGAIILAFRFVDESRERGAGRTDYPGALLATAGLGGLTYALTLWSAERQLTTAALVALVAGIVVSAAFLWNEHRRGTRAMMPLSLFEGRCFSGLNLLTFLLYGAFGAAMLLIPYALITSGGLAGAGRPRLAPADRPDDNSVPADGKPGRPHRSTIPLTLGPAKSSPPGWYCRYSPRQAAGTGPAPSR